jgi:hypothetical protein
VERLDVRPLRLESGAPVFAVNTDFEGRALERVRITVSLADFCEQHYHRLPHQYWRDPARRPCLQGCPGAIAREHRQHA